jgi:hypothetical protein
MTVEFAQFVDRFWENGAAQYFTNLRRLKLFANKISYSLPLVGEEVNFQDFLAIELIRDIDATLYEFIYTHGEYFYDPRMAFETWGQQVHPLNDEKARKERAEFYEKLKNSVPADRQYVFSIVAGLFPLYAEAESRITWNKTDELEGEKEKRIWHPRFFRQYFIFRVPPELFSQKEFNAFRSSIKTADADKAASEFSRRFSIMLNEDFKRWHFMHLIDMAFPEFAVDAARGLCIGMARNASVWSRDAFEFIIALRCTRETIAKINDSGGSQDFLRTCIRETTSDLYAVFLVSWVPEDTSAPIQSELEKAKPYVKEQLRAHYLVRDPPSIFEQFQFGDPIRNIDPNQFQFAWRQLGEDAEADQRLYLKTLLTEKPKNIDKFLRTMFRVEFMDDYTALKPLIDYKELFDLITANEDKLDPKNVRLFMKRYAAEHPPAGSPA